MFANRETFEVPFTGVWGSSKAELIAAIKTAVPFWIARTSETFLYECATFENQRIDFKFSPHGYSYIMASSFGYNVQSLLLLNNSMDLWHDGCFWTFGWDFYAFLCYDAVSNKVHDFCSWKLILFKFILTQVQQVYIHVRAMLLIVIIRNRRFWLPTINHN